MAAFPVIYLGRVTSKECFCKDVNDRFTASKDEGPIPCGNTLFQSGNWTAAQRTKKSVSNVSLVQELLRKLRSNVTTPRNWVTVPTISELIRFMSRLQWTSSPDLCSSSSSLMSVLLLPFGFRGKAVNSVLKIYLMRVFTTCSYWYRYAEERKAVWRYDRVTEWVISSWLGLLVECVRIGLFGKQIGEWGDLTRNEIALICLLLVLIFCSRVYDICLPSG